MSDSAAYLELLNTADNQLDATPNLARLSYLKALEIGGNADPYCHLRIGNTYEDEGDAELAREHYLTSLQQAEGTEWYLMSLLDLATFYANMEEWPDYDTCTAAIIASIGPDCFSFWAATTFYTLGRACLLNEEYLRAEAMLTAAWNAFQANICRHALDYKAKILDCGFDLGITLFMLVNRHDARKVLVRVMLLASTFRLPPPEEGEPVSQRAYQLYLSTPDEVRRMMME